MRSLAYFTLWSTTAFAPPSAAPASLMRPMFRMFTAILKPFCRSLSMFSTGTLQSLKNTWRVLLPLIPIFFSSGFSVMPPKSFSTMKAVRFSSSPTLANTVKMSAKPPLVIHIF